MAWVLINEDNGSIGGRDYGSKEAAEAAIHNSNIPDDFAKAKEFKMPFLNKCHRPGKYLDGDWEKISERRNGCCEFTSNCSDIKRMRELEALEQSELVNNPELTREFENLKNQYEHLCTMGLALRVGALPCLLRKDYLSKNLKSAG